MSDNSPRLELPLLQPAQAQKHVTHNEALRVLDILVQLTVEEFDATEPPAAPVEGKVYAIGAGATGAWFGSTGHLAVYVDGSWQFHAPAAGWYATRAGTAEMRVFTGSAWDGISGATASTQDLDGIGINAVSDPVNRLSVASAASLFSHEGSGHQVKINKAAAADTASVLLQTAWSGRAEIGLAGDDGLSIKLSADGATWDEALHLSAGDQVFHTGNMVGTVSAPPGPGAALFETATNANGSYTRFADGTQMCWKNDFVAAGAGGGVWTFPAPIVDANAAGTATARDGFARFIAVTGVTAAQAALNSFTQPGGTALPDTNVIAIGRWF